MGASGSTSAAGNVFHAGLNAGDPDDSVADCWVAKEKVRDVYLTEDPEVAAGHLDDTIDWCIAEQSSPELATLAKTLRRWHPEILARHTTGASNGRVEAANLLIKACETLRPRIQQPPQLPASHPPHRRAATMPDSTRHENPNPPSQVGRVGPLKDLDLERATFNSRRNSTSSSRSAVVSPPPPRPSSRSACFIQPRRPAVGDPEIRSDLADRLVAHPSQLDSTSTELGRMWSRHLDFLSETTNVASDRMSVNPGYFHCRWLRPRTTRPRPGRRWTERSVTPL